MVQGVLPAPKACGLTWTWGRAVDATLEPRHFLQLSFERSMTYIRQHSSLMAGGTSEDKGRNLPPAHALAVGHGNVDIATVPETGALWPQELSGVRFSS